MKKSVMFIGAFLLVLLLVYAASPVVNSIFVNSTSTINSTWGNLTANINATDADGDVVQNLIWWQKNGVSRELLYFAFENSSNAYNATNYARPAYNGSDSSDLTYVPTGGHSGAAYYFNGELSNLELDAVNFPYIGYGAYTLTAWFRTNGSADTQAFFGFNGEQPAFFLNATNYLTIYDGDTLETLSSPRNASVADDVWHHVAFVRTNNGTNGTEFFIDGISLGFSQHASLINATDAFTPVLYIGTDGCDCDQSFFGLLDEVRFYDFALTDAEILTQYSNRTDILPRQSLEVANYSACTASVDNTSSPGNTLCSANISLVQGLNFTATIINDNNTVLPTTVVTVNTSITTGQGTVSGVRLLVTPPNSSAYNVTPTNISDVYSANITLNETGNWTFKFFATDSEVTDGSAVAETLQGNPYITVSSMPFVTDFVLYTSSGLNTSSENLTLAVNTTNPNSGTVRTFVSWYKNGIPRELLYLGFENSSNVVNTTDYAGRDDDGASLIGTPLHLPAGGYDGGGAFNFSAAEEGISLDASTFPDIGLGNYTLSAWIKTNHSAAFYQAIFSFNNYDPGFFVSNADSLLVYDDDDHESPGTTFITDNSWHHVAFVRHNTSATGLEFFVDGVSLGLENHSPSVSISNIYVGTDNCNCDEDFHGNIDELRFFNSSLPDEAITALAADTKNVIVSQELEDGNWTACVTPNDGFVDGPTTCQNITIGPYTAPPILSSITNGTVTTSTTSITWTTDLNANSSVNYGTTTALGTTSSSASLTTSHSQTLSSLSSSTTYYYNVTSCSSGGSCNTSGPNNFTTAAASSGSSGGGSSGGGGGGMSYVHILTKEPKKFGLNEYGSFYFKSQPDKKTSNIRVKELKPKVKIQVDNKKEFVLNDSDNIEVDYEDDSEPDVRVQLLSHTDTTAILTVALPVSTGPPPGTDPPEFIGKPNTENDTDFNETNSTSGNTSVNVSVEIQVPEIIVSENTTINITITTLEDDVEIEIETSIEQDEEIIVQESQTTTVAATRSGAFSIAIPSLSSGNYTLVVTIETPFGQFFDRAPFEVVVDEKPPGLMSVFADRLGIPEISLWVILLFLIILAVFITYSLRRQEDVKKK